MADRPFPYTWTSSTQAKGTSDAQLWVSMRSGRPTPFDQLELRGWANLGVTRTVDLHLGLESSMVLLRREEKAFDGAISTMARFRLLEADQIIGLALLARGAFGISGAALEARLVLDRRIGDVLIAANSSFERTIFWNRRDDIDTRFEHSLAVQLRITPEVSAGLEGRVRQALRAGEYQGSAVVVGPTLSISTRWVWFSIGVVAQVTADKAEGDRGNGQPLTFRDDERFGVRLVVGAPLKSN